MLIRISSAATRPCLSARWRSERNILRRSLRIRLIAGIVTGMAVVGMTAPLFARGSVPANQSQPSAQAIGNADSNVVVALGDSLTAGYGAPPGKSYPDFLEEYLYDSGYPYRVENYGRDGATSVGCARLLGKVEKRKPALVIVIVGANDALSRIPIPQTSTDLEQILSSLQNSGSKVILGEQPLSQDYGAEYIRQYQAMFAALAQQYKIPLDKNLYRDLTNIPSMLQADGVHPTAEGNAQFARNILPLVKSALIKHHRPPKRHHSFAPSTALAQ